MAPFCIQIIINPYSQGVFAKKCVIYTAFIHFLRKYYEMQNLNVIFANDLKRINVFSFFCNFPPTKTVY